MSEIVLRPYQQPLYDDIWNGLSEHQKVLGQAETGWGKSILIGKLANKLPGRCLILTHRIELLNQNSEWIREIGKLTAKVRKVQHLRESRNVISMAQTCRARFEKYGADYIGKFDYVICDEIHVDHFKVVYDQLPEAKVIAVTATPIIDKKEEKTIDGVKFVRKLTLADEFDVLYQGVKTKELIELGYLTQDFNIQLTPPDLSKLKNSSSTPDGYTSKSLSEVFGSNASIETVLEGYNKYCSKEANGGKAKKTLIFNPTTKVNLDMFEAFKEKGLECRLYDSVNETEYSRKEITEWFTNTPGAILLNVGVFTTGFSVNDVEAIIYNKKTKSLSLWLQSIGRGSRILNSEQLEKGMVKQNFLVLDMGLNIAEHGKWSDDRDWHQHFKIHKWKQKKESDLLRMWECKACGNFNLEGRKLDSVLECLVCEKCGTPKPKKKRKKKLIDGKFVVMEEPIHPNAGKILEYVVKVGGDQNMMFKIGREQILDLFKYHVTPADYKSRRDRYIRRISELYRPIYFLCINTRELKQGANRTLQRELNWIKEAVEKYLNV